MLFGSLISAIVVGYLASRVSATLSMNIRKKLFTRVQNLAMNEIKQLSTSSLITRTTNDITQIQMLMAMGLQLIIKSPIMAIWAIRKILTKNWQWSALVGGGVIVLLTVIAILMKIVIPKFKIVQKLTDKINSVTRENLTGIRVVRAFNADGGYSAYVYANTSTRKYMATPKLTTIYNHQNGLAIKWNAVAGVTNGYRVYRRGAGSTSWTYLGTTKNLYFIDSQVKNRNGEYFRYTVIADGGYHSKFDTTGLYLRRLANPTLNSAVSSKSGITVKWGKVAGSSGYYVYRKTANSTWTRIAVVKGVNGLSYLDKTAKKGTTYTYTVRAVYGNTLSSYYSGISCKDKY